MPDGAHFRKPDDNATPGRMRRWWPVELAVPIAIALVITIVLMAEASGHPGSHAAAQRPKVASASSAAESAAPIASTTTTATPPDDPYLQPDGSAQPVLVVFNGSSINLTGAVPSAALGQKLSTLATAYSQTPNAQVVSNLVVDSRVPTSTGVRVLEMNSPRFASGSSEVTPDYAAELNRVVTILKALPNLTALVVAHADQTGSSGQNLTLSQARAAAVIQYLTSQGISSDRLTGQGAGDGTPLTQQTDAAGLALNRRTEFVFYGLLTGP